MLAAKRSLGSPGKKGGGGGGGKKILFVPSLTKRMREKEKEREKIQKEALIYQRQEAASFSSPWDKCPRASNIRSSSISVEKSSARKVFPSSFEKEDVMRCYYNVNE